MTPAAFLFEFLAPFGPIWSALFSGFACIGLDGQMYLTAAGSTYLESQGAD